MDSVSDGSTTLVALRQIQPVGDTPPFRIVFTSYRQGTVMSAEELMAAKLKWVVKAGFTVLTDAVPPEFLPYNAVIRVSSRNTEDRNLDYLAQIVQATSASG